MPLYNLFGSLAQLVEHLLDVQGVRHAELYKIEYGRLAQLVEHVLDVHGVGDSTSSAPTKSQCRMRDKPKPLDFKGFRTFQP